MGAAIGAIATIAGACTQQTLFVDRSAAAGSAVQHHRISAQGASRGQYLVYHSGPGRATQPGTTN
ncbi:conserved hypothetical protein [Ricinus communis]|uniref:Uncharacterized protein n=1 Tax=Ricinus communis TaxID=3988 RepID=B9TC83_RICCO|nr:conserved hypothetical protein [Ricinus communis]